MQINRTNLLNYFWKVPISHIIQNHYKKLALLWALQLQLNCGAYPIRQPLSLKLPVDSQCIQVSSSKVFLFQMLGETSMFTLPGKVPVWQKCQNVVLSDNINLNFSPYILKFKLFFKNSCSTMTDFSQFIIDKP